MRMLFIVPAAVALSGSIVAAARAGDQRAPGKRDFATMGPAGTATALRQPLPWTVPHPQGAAGLAPVAAPAAAKPAPAFAAVPFSGQALAEAERRQEEKRAAATRVIPPTRGSVHRDPTGSAERPAAARLIPGVAARPGLSGSLAPAAQAMAARLMRERFGAPVPRGGTERKSADIRTALPETRLDPQQRAKLAGARAVEAGRAGPHGAPDARGRERGAP
jgi:hypothetical protein